MRRTHRPRLNQRHAAHQSDRRTNQAASREHEHDRHRRCVSQSGESLVRHHEKAAESRLQGRPSQPARAATCSVSARFPRSLTSRMPVDIVNVSVAPRKRRRLPTRLSQSAPGRSGFRRNRERGSSRTGGSQRPDGCHGRVPCHSSLIAARPLEERSLTRKRDAAFRRAPTSPVRVASPEHRADRSPRGRSPAG